MRSSVLSFVFWCTCSSVLSGAALVPIGYKEVAMVMVVGNGDRNADDTIMIITTTKMMITVIVTVKIRCYRDG